MKKQGHKDEGEWDDPTLNTVANYIDRIFREPKALSRLEAVRAKFNIPMNGYKEVFIKEATENGPVVWCIPEHVNEDEFRKSIAIWVNELGLPWYWVFTFEHIVLYDEPYVDQITSYGGLVSTCDLVSEIEHHREQLSTKYYPDKTLIDNKVYNHIEWELWSDESIERPIALLISPYALKQDVLNYVKDKFDTNIEPLQKEYRKKDVKLGKTRKTDRRKTDRNTYIFENRKVGAKKLVGMVYDKFGEPMLGYDYIQKIIRNEERMRGMR